MKRVYSLLVSVLIFLVYSEAKDQTTNENGVYEKAINELLLKMTSEDHFFHTNCY